MERERRGPTPERGGAINFGALIEGLSLLLLFAAFAVGAYLMLPGTSAEAPDEAQLCLPDDDVLPSPVFFSQHGATHLIMIVDEDLPLSRVSVTGEWDTGLGRVQSVEVIQASTAALQGLREAVDTAAAICPTSNCPQIVVVDLQTAAPGTD